MQDQKIRELICELCRTFYQLGWSSGTGGGISIKEGSSIYMAPSGIQKERMQPEDIFELDLSGTIISDPGHELKLSQCAPIFYKFYDLRQAGAVLHSHSKNAVLITILNKDKNVFSVSGMEMIKGIQGRRASDILEIPIIENTDFECDLTDTIAEALVAYPQSPAVLVRHHGIYVSGRTWTQAKTQAECLDYLFDIELQRYELKIFSERYLAKNIPPIE